MTLRLAFLALVAVTALSLTAPHVIPRLSVLSGLWWWPATVLSLAVAAALGLNWIRKASDKSPMQFVAAVNGTTAMKLFTTLGWLTAFLVSNEEARLEFVFGAFGVFVLYTVVIVAATVGSGDQKQKN